MIYRDGRMSETPEEYKGKKVLVRFDGSKCIHARQCVLGRPDVFVPNAEGPWIQPDQGSAETVAAVARTCPSGAITYERLDGGEGEEAPKVNIVRVRENGPLAVHADLQIEGETPRFRATLCRCGASKNKPFCDGSHTAANFVATGEIAPQESKELEARDGVLTITPCKNGPLLMHGNIEVCTGTGKTILKATKTARCRCGASSNKPFCDGTHSKIGFTS